MSHIPMIKKTSLLHYFPTKEWEIHFLAMSYEMEKNVSHKIKMWIYEDENKWFINANPRLYINVVPMNINIFVHTYFVSYLLTHFFTFLFHFTMLLFSALFSFPNCFLSFSLLFFCFLLIVIICIITTNSSY